MKARALVERLDDALDATVVGSFTRLGPALRRRAFSWARLETGDATGRTIVVTGATSGLGEAAAHRLADLGATVLLVGRDRDRAERVRAAIEHRRGPGQAQVLVADLADLDQVRHLASAIRERTGRLDALVHNAGALLAAHTVSPQGIEVTVATQVLAPFLLTAELRPLLAATPGSRVVFVTSGGMYSERLDVDHLELGPGEYDGVVAYARAKRAQMALTEAWARRLAPDGVVVHAMHPGWADTPGVRASLPTFRRLTAPLLRTAEEGADTMVWLAVADEPLGSTGRLWLDRRPRPAHRLPRTRRPDEPAEIERLWAHCAERTATPDIDEPETSTPARR